MFPSRRTAVRSRIDGCRPLPRFENGSAIEEIFSSWIFAILFFTIQTCGAISDSLHGPVIWIPGYHYGVYDQWPFDLPQANGSTMNVYGHLGVQDPWYRSMGIRSNLKHDF